MSETANPRPGQVTMAGWMVVVGSILLVLVSFQSLSDLQTIDVRENIARTLDKRNLGISVDAVIQVMRVGLFVVGAAGAAAGVLGGYILRRSRQARIALSIVAVPILMSIFLVQNALGTFFASLIAASTALLWTLPARDWFAGRAARPVQPRGADPRASGVGPWQAPPPQPPARPDAAQQPPQPPASGDQPWLHAPSPVAPYSVQQPTAVRADADDEIPVTVRVACQLTIWFSALAAVVMLAAAVVIAAKPSVLPASLVDREVRWTDVTRDQVPWLVAGLAVMLACWAVGAIVLAWFVRRRHEWAWVLLVISSGCAGLLMIFMLPVSIAHVLGAVATFTALLREPSRAWIGRRAPRDPAAGGQKRRPW